MKKLCISISLTIVLSLVLSACAQQATTETVTVTGSPTTVTTTATPTPSEWDKVVAAAIEEGELVVYSSTISGEFGRKVTKAFEAAYPGIKLQALPAGAGANQEKIIAEYQANKPVADAVEGGYTLAFADLTKGGYTQPWGDLPSLADREAFKADPLLDEDGYNIVAWATLPMYIIVNNDLVTPEEEPKTYQELIDPKWKGKIMLHDPTTAGGGSYLLATWVDVGIVDTDWLHKLAENDVVLQGSYDEDVARVARGEIPISLLGVGAIVGKYIAEGAPIRISVIAQERGLVVGIQTLALLEKARHPNAAKVFLNWLLSPEGAEARAQAAGDESFRKGGGDYKAEALRALELPGIVIPSLNALELQYEWVQEGTMNFFKD
ncbi:ABC transporter substrate-binding protein [Chloroflexota bacterium]